MSLAARHIAANNSALNSTRLAGYLKASADQLRLDILRVLKHNAYSVLELCQLFAVRQSGMSHHLKVLAGAGLVATRREGNTIFYRRSPASNLPELSELHRELFAAIDQLAIDNQVAQQMEAINRVRSETSRNFFAENAERFADNQDLIASFSDYGPAIVEILNSQTTQKNSALEIGPGRGELLPELSELFDQVIALDNAEQILTLAREFAATEQLDNVQFQLGDITRKINLAPVNCITLNMVLHHIAQPSELFPRLAQLLLPGGILLVTDLCEHQQDWVRESCGDLWQGFSEQELGKWATDAGLETSQALFLALRNGFKIQLIIFRKPD